MKFVKIGAVVLFTFSLASASAEYEDYVRLTKTDGSSGNSWNQKGNWETDWDSSRDYYVPSSRGLWPLNNDANAWQGGKMAVEGYLKIQFSKSATKLPQFEDITFLDGSYISGSWNHLGLLNSKVTVNASVENPFEVRMKSGSVSYDIKARFDGSVFTSANGEDTAVRVLVQEHEFQPYNVCSLDKCNFENYAGTFIADSTQLVVKARSGAGGLAFGGAVVVTNGATIVGAESDSDWTSYATLPAASLTLTENGVVKLWQKGMAIRPVLDLAKALSMEGLDSIRIGGTTAADWEDLDLATATEPSTNRLTVATISGPSALCPTLPGDKVALVGSDGTGPMAVLDWRYDAAENGRGGYDVAIAHTNQIVGMIKDNSTGDGSQAFTCSDAELAQYWSDGRRPTADSTADYVCYKRFYPYTDINLPKATMTFLTDGSVYCNGGGSFIRMRELNLVGESSFMRYSTSDGMSAFVLNFEGGRINLIGDAVQTFHAWSSRGFRFSSEICGTGSLVLKNRNKTGRFYLDAYNTNWVGKLTIANVVAAEDDVPITVQLSDARNWGGTGSAAADAYDAITLQDSPIVNVSNDVCFAATDRSMFVTNGVRFVVDAGKTLTLGNRITYFGDLDKQGAGTLALGGAAAFLEGGESGNGLTIEKGALKVGSKTAVDGLDVSFAAGTKLVVPVGTDGGLYNVKSANPLTFADAQLAVDIVGIDERPQDDVEVTLCTLNATAAQSVPATAFAVTRTAACRVKSVEKRTLADGTVAYVATVPGKKGLMLIFR